MKIPTVGSGSHSIPAAGFPFTLTADEFQADGADTTKATYAGPPSSSTIVTSKPLPIDGYKGVQIAFKLVISEKRARLPDTDYEFIMDDKEGKKMSGPLPPQSIAAATTRADADLANKLISSAEHDAFIKELNTVEVTCTKGGGSMETMLVVVLGLAVVWMLMNYKK